MITIDVVVKDEKGLKMCCFREYLEELNTLILVVGSSVHSVLDKDIPREEHFLKAIYRLKEVMENGLG